MIYSYNKRHSVGTLMPNLFFILQLIAIAILSYILTSIAPLLNFSSGSDYLIGGLAVGVIIYCIDKRHTVLKRQGFI